MKIKLATYNAMNLFSRARPISVVDDWNVNKPILEDIAALNDLLDHAVYSPADKQAISDILVRNNLATLSLKDDKFTINQVREKLYTNPSNGVINIKATGRGSWLGWVEPFRETLPAPAFENTARVIAAVDADILCLVEIEDRPTLERFHTDVMVGEGFLSGDRVYPYNMLIDGNDDRGIDVSIYSRYPIKKITSHIKDTYVGNGQKFPIFSRDCAEYEVEIAPMQKIWLLANHLKSKGFGTQQSSNAKRKRQAQKIKEILAQYDLAKQYVVVAGDFNDTPDSAYLAPILKEVADLHDVLLQLPAGERWTYKGGSQQIDYLLVSTPLWNKIGPVGIERRGIYRKAALGHPDQMFPEVKDLTTQASDHGAVWAEFDL